MRTRPLAALLLAGALLFTGCSEEEPKPRIAAEPSAMPTVVKEESAEEFIRRWNDEQREMQKGDTSEYRKIASECEPCMETADQVDEIYSAGGYVRTEGRSLLSIRKSDRSPNTKYAFLIEVDSAPTSYKTSAKAPEEHFDGGVSVYEVYLAKRRGTWRLIETWQVPL